MEIVPLFIPLNIMMALDLQYALFYTIQAASIRFDFIVLKKSEINLELKAFTAKNILC